MRVICPRLPFRRDILVKKIFFTISLKIRDIPDWCKLLFGLLVIPGA